MMKTQHCIEEQLRQEGFLVLPFGAQLITLMKQHICQYFNFKHSISEEEMTSSIQGFSEEFWRDKCARSNRNYPDYIASELCAWVSLLADVFGECQLGVNYVSSFMRAENSELKESSLDCFWRCVRPNMPDVGHPHRDSQFWKIYKGTSIDPPLPFEYDERWKVWIPLFGCNSSNSLQVVPRSHMMDVPVGTIEVDAGHKPTIEQDWIDSQEWICPFSQFNGTECILFHDDLVHRGPMNSTPLVRISSEFTVLLKRS